LAAKIGLTLEEREAFVLNATSAHARSKRDREEARAKMERSPVLKTHELSSDQFEMISHWYSFAVLELLRTSEAKRLELRDGTWIARRLQISIHQALSSLERLERLGLIEVRHGRVIPKVETWASPDGVPSLALKNFHEQWLEKARHALYEQTVEERDFRSVTLRCTKGDLPWVRERLKKFMLELDRDLSRALDDKIPGQEVYQLNSQFFRLSKTDH
jgi:uncharacterized protein (TIGR02147 family)